MPMPVRALPMTQNWDCHSCGSCCRSYAVGISDEERDTLLKQGWMSDPALNGREPFKRDSGKYLLNTTPDGSCVFLDENNRCRIHAKFGEAAKPLACRVYPFVLFPAGDHWRIGLRYACPSSVKNEGRPIVEHQSTLDAFAALAEADSSEEFLKYAPQLHEGQAVEWPDVIRLTRAFVDLLSETDTPVELRLRRVWHLAEVCRKSRLQAISGPKLAEFLRVMSAVARDETPTDPNLLKRPGRVTRMIARNLFAIFSRKDTGPYASAHNSGRMARLKAAFAFATGFGTVPPLNQLLPRRNFSELEQPAAPLTATAVERITRYYIVKLQSFQFFGPTHFFWSYWDGLLSLLLTYPVLMWMIRAYTSDTRHAEDAAFAALQMTDFNFGYNKLLGAPRQRTAYRMIADRGDLPKLIAWYSRTTTTAG